MRSYTFSTLINFLFIFTLFSFATLSLANSNFSCSNLKEGKLFVDDSDKVWLIDKVFKEEGAECNIKAHRAFATFFKPNMKKRVSKSIWPDREKQDFNSSQLENYDHEINVYPEGYIPTKGYVRNVDKKDSAIGNYSKVIAVLKSGKLIVRTFFMEGPFPTSYLLVVENESVKDVSNVNPDLLKKLTEKRLKEIERILSNISKDLSNTVIANKSLEEIGLNREVKDISRNKTEKLINDIRSNLEEYRDATSVSEK